MSFGIKAVKPGKDVNSTDPRDWNLNTSYPLLKVFGVYTGTVTAGGSATITHSLGYRPITLFYFTPAAGGSDYYFFSGVAGGAALGGVIGTNTITISSVGVAGSYQVIIFYDSAE